MEAMNRAIEDASDYAEFQRKLLSQEESDRRAMRSRLPAELTPAAAKRMVSPRRPGENREQHRARLFGKDQRGRHGA